MTLILAVNPVIATLGQISAVIILLFVFVFVIIAVAFNLAMALGLGWVREKAELIKLLRPNVDSVNKVSEAALHGTPPASSENSIIKAVAQVPMQVEAADKKVEQVTDTVADKVIEFRARTVQVQAIVKTFFAPREKPLALSRPEAMIKSPGYRILIEETNSTEKIRKLSAENARIAEQKGTDSSVNNGSHR
jgi:hypothetical protein